MPKLLSPLRHLPYLGTQALMDATELNEHYGLPGALEFVAGPGGMPHALLRAGGYAAELALQGAHVVRFGQDAAEPLLWLSREAIFAPGKAIRGGIPLCWPWFGPHPERPDLPAHGFVRTRMWAVSGSGSQNERTWLSLALHDDETTLALWPHPFTLELTVSVGPELDVALTMINSGPTPFVCGGALHSYLTVGDVRQVQLHGLEGRHYLDQLSGTWQTQEGPVTVAAEVDRIYQDDGAATVVEDPLLGRRISVAKAGSGTTVVWNPWIEKARRLADFADDEYLSVLCVETALAGDDRVSVAPGTRHTLRATISAAI